LNTRNASPEDTSSQLLETYCVTEEDSSDPDSIFLCPRTTALGSSISLTPSSNVATEQGQAALSLNPAILRVVNGIVQIWRMRARVVAVIRFENAPVIRLLLEDGASQGKNILQIKEKLTFARRLSAALRTAPSLNSASSTSVLREVNRLIPFQFGSQAYYIDLFNDLSQSISRVRASLSLTPQAEASSRNINLFFKVPCTGGNRSPAPGLEDCVELAQKVARHFRPTVSIQELSAIRGRLATAVRVEIGPNTHLGVKYLDGSAPAIQQYVYVNASSIDDIKILLGKLIEGGIRLNP
jgi:hypothetical protein